MNLHLSAGAVALVLALAGVPASAQQQDAIVVNIAGPCQLVLGGRSMGCVGVAYMAFAGTHRIDFTAVTSQSSWAFSGEEDANDDGRYSLTVDSVLSPQAGRVEADGECTMDLAEDRRTVRGLECQAMTPAGPLTLKASGRVVSAAGGDDDDGDDDSGDGGGAQG
jgi:hypothetical protein